MVADAGEQFVAKVTAQLGQRGGQRRLSAREPGGGGDGSLGQQPAEAWVPNPNGLSTDEIRAQLRRLYLDTAATGFPSCLTAALTMTTPDHLVYGSDSGVPCSTEETIEASRKSLLEFDGLTMRQRQDIGRNATALFPNAAARLDG
ncbi:hypothetical protein [Amycolatopsis sp. cg13]|uniref:hypothetical protein n=1 Tax=Amycolatopsis sp. cg13 TaxID=3238807 RepID=UPI003525E77B